MPIKIQLYLYRAKSIYSDSLMTRNGHLNELNIQLVVLFVSMKGICLTAVTDQHSEQWKSPRNSGRSKLEKGRFT